MYIYRCIHVYTHIHVHVYVCIKSMPCVYIAICIQIIYYKKYVCLKLLAAKDGDACNVRVYLYTCCIYIVNLT